MLVVIVLPDQQLSFSQWELVEQQLMLSIKSYREINKNLAKYSLIYIHSKVLSTLAISKSQLNPHQELQFRNNLHQYV